MTMFNRTHRAERSVVFIKKSDSSGGVTLLEIMVSMGILVIIAAIGLGGLNSFRESSSLDQSVDSAMGLLRQAREKTLGSENASVYGVHFASTSITYFVGGVYSSGAVGNTVVPLPYLVSVSSISLSTTTANIVFDRLTGNSSVTGTITFLSSRSNQTRKIQIYASGNFSKQ